MYSGDEEEDNVYGLRLERSRRRDYAFHYEEPYKIWRPCDEPYGNGTAIEVRTSWGSNIGNLAYGRLSDGEW